MDFCRPQNLWVAVAILAFLSAVYLLVQKGLYAGLVGRKLIQSITFFRALFTILIFQAPCLALSS